MCNNWDTEMLACLSNSWSCASHFSSVAHRILFDGITCPHLAELLQLPAQPEGGEEGVLAGQRNQGGAWQRFVDIEARARVTQAVHVWAGHTLHTVTAHLQHQTNSVEQWSSASRNVKWVLLNFRDNFTSQIASYVKYNTGDCIYCQ